MSDRDDDAFAEDSFEYKPRDDGKSGPPDDWRRDSWYDRQDRDWWWKKRPDPCPVRPLGHTAGEYLFMTAAGEIRPFKSGALHGRGGLADLFGGRLTWAMRHFQTVDGDGRPTGKFAPASCIAALIRACIDVGYIDDALPRRGVGIWRGPDGSPLVHAGDRILYGGEIHAAGVKIDDALYTIGGALQGPAIVQGDDGRYEYQPASTEIGRWVVGAVHEWHWDSIEAAELFAGGGFHAMLGDVPLWRTHMFIQAPPGAGKSTLLRFHRALLGGGAHPVMKSYSKAYLEQKLSHRAQAIILDETESDSEAERIRHLFELVRLLSDDGARGGRGSTSGKVREFDVHGAVTMAATVRERWRPQDRQRIALLELRPLKERINHPPAPPTVIDALIAKASEVSAALRARAMVKWPLYVENFKAARQQIMDLGGTTRDGDQLGHLIAGYWTLIYDEPPDEERIADVNRYRPFICSLIEGEEGDDEPSDCFNALMGSPCDLWRGGDRFTVGQILARAREDDAVGEEMREALPKIGLRLVRLPGETWMQAWLAIANKHEGLSRQFAGHPEWGNQKWNQILKGLDEAKVSGGNATRFAGQQSRSLLVPPKHLPSLKDEREETQT